MIAEKGWRETVSAKWDQLEFDFDYAEEQWKDYNGNHA